MEAICYGVQSISSQLASKEKISGATLFSRTIVLILAAMIGTIMELSMQIPYGYSWCQMITIMSGHLKFSENNRPISLVTGVNSSRQLGIWRGKSAVEGISFGIS